MRILIPLMAVVLLSACRPAGKIVEVQTEVLAIDTTTDAIQDTAYLRILAPMEEAMQRTMGEVIGYAPAGMRAYRPESELANWASDALLEIARKEYACNVDMAVVNLGGLRCEWQQGDITLMNVYELMPFDNKLVVLTLSGKEILELSKIIVGLYGEGIAGLRVCGKDGQLKEATIGGKMIDPEAEYHVATSDYLSGGMDKMVPLARYSEMWNSGENIRDLYIDYIREKKVVKSTLDGRVKI